jgi:catechol 2,3-dioxygenase-like lactoylglutathione lyase family enzyme
MSSDQTPSLDDPRQWAELQRNYDYYCERRGLPLASVKNLRLDEFEAFVDDEQAIHDAYFANQRAMLALHDELRVLWDTADAAFGPDPHRTAEEVAPSDLIARWHDLARQGQRLARMLGYPVTAGVDENGEGWIVVGPSKGGPEA